jgi:Mn-dependent DtxR family transcriptional regulator
MGIDKIILSYSIKRRNMLYESGEDYLEKIYIMSLKSSEIHKVDIANEFNYSKPSITRAIKILTKNGYIEVDSVTNHIFLTEAGIIKAKEVLDKHEVLTAFWIKLGVSEEIAEKDACHMEHLISNETFEVVKKYINSKN